MEESKDWNCRHPDAVKRNKGGGIDRMTTKELESHLQAHWERFGEAVGGNLCSESRKAGGNTQTERRHANAGDSDGTGSVDSADDVAGADTDLRSAVQRAQLRIPTGAQCAGCRASAQKYAQEGKTGCGYRHHKVLRPTSIMTF